MKYDKDAPFQDPVVRCDACKKLLRVERLKTLGMCECGNRKVRNVLTYTGEELEQMQEWGVDPEFLGMFREVADG